MKLYSWATQCAGKVKHPTRRSARRHRRQHPAEKLHIYRCGWCGFLHVGHLPNQPYVDDPHHDPVAPVNGPMQRLQPDAHELHRRPEG